MKIITLGHYKRVGKDTFADYLIEACHTRAPLLRVAKRSWAWKLKQICHELYGWAGLREPEFYETAAGAALREVVLAALGKSPRQIWIDFGTPAVRERVYDRTWVDYLLNTPHDLDVMIIPDTRFANEIAAVKAKGGQAIKVVRPGYGPGKNKPDRELVGFGGWDNVIGATGTLEELRFWADAYADWLTGRRDLVRPTRDQIEAARAVETIEPWDDLASAA